MTIEEKSSSRVNGAIGLVIAIVVIAVIIGLWLTGRQSSGTGTIRQVTYSVTADGGYAQIIYTNSNGVTTEPIMVTTPYSNTINLPVGIEIYLTASNPSQTGSVSCKIKINGRDWKESKGTHPIDSVACAGIIK